MTTDSSTSPALRSLARHEIRRYLRHKLYWLGAAGVAVFFVLDVTGNSDTGGESSVMGGIGTAALLGVFGLLVMVSLTRGSDRAAQSAGSVVVPERTRTLALAAAVVVPVSTALISWIGQVIGYLLHPPSAETLGGLDVSHGYVMAALFGQSVMAAAGGPLLGLVLARWLPHRGIGPVAAVVVVLVTILNQGLFDSTRPWRTFWVWTHWYGPFGFGDEAERWMVLPGSPYLWILYLATVCVLGVLLAVAHDPELDRGPWRRAIVATLLVAVVLGLLTVLVPLGGFGETVVNQISEG